MFSAFLLVEVSDLAEEEESRVKWWSKMSEVGAKLAPSWGQVGAKLGPSWAKLDPNWAQVGASWAKMGPSWGHVGLQDASKIDLRF